MKILTLTILLLSTIWCSAMDRWAALSMLESGDCDTCIGPGGEVSRYQITIDNWRSYVVLGTAQEAADPHLAKIVAQQIMFERIMRYEKTLYPMRAINTGEFALLWHCPARVKHPRPADLDYAQRFYNLVHKDEIEKGKGSK